MPFVEQDFQSEIEPARDSLSKAVFTPLAFQAWIKFCKVLRLDAPDLVHEWETEYHKLRKRREHVQSQKKDWFCPDIVNALFEQHILMLFRSGVWEDWAEGGADAWWASHKEAMQV